MRGRANPFLTPSPSLSVRRDIDDVLDCQIEEWYRTVPYADHFEGRSVDRDYYRRHVIEMARRIHLLRVAESKAIPEMAKTSPEAAQIFLHAGDEIAQGSCEVFVAQCLWTYELATRDHLLPTLLDEAPRAITVIYATPVGSI